MLRIYKLKNQMGFYPLLIDSLLEPVRGICLSYQKRLLPKLKYFTGLRDQIVTWNDQDLLPGEGWYDKIKDELHNADVVLYPDFSQ